MEGSVVATVVGSTCISRKGAECVSLMYYVRMFCFFCAGLTGCAKNKDVFISIIPIISCDVPFQSRRLQFPLRLLFAVSINKYKGSPLKLQMLILRLVLFRMNSYTRM
jgi:hypothetical protein